jgi:hypothetical protein
MSVAPPAHLVQSLLALSEDAFFTIASTAALEPEALAGVSQRRKQARAAGARGGAVGLSSWDEWVVAMSLAIAPIAQPRWLPMAEVIDELTLERGARGVRSFFTSKPSDKQVQRVRVLGAIAARSLASVLGVTGNFHAEARLLRRTLLGALGLPDDEVRALDAEDALKAEAIDIPVGSDPKVMRAIVRGVYFAAMGDGMDPREEQVAQTIARRAGLSTEETNQAFTDAKLSVDAHKEFGLASVDAVRFLLADDKTEAEPLAIATARLTLPVVYRREALTAVNLGSPVVLGGKHHLERKQRAAVLGLSWFTALRNDPTTTRRAVLASRHERIAIDLGSAADGGIIRNDIDRFVESELGSA